MVTVPTLSSSDPPSCTNERNVDSSSLRSPSGGGQRDPSMKNESHLPERLIRQQEPAVCHSASLNDINRSRQFSES